MKQPLFFLALFKQRFTNLSLNTDLAYYSESQIKSACNQNVSISVLPFT